LAVSLGLIVLFGLAADVAFRRLKLPGLVGMLLVGVVVGPHLLGLLDPDMERVSADFRKMALIVILLRAGFELRRDTLKKVGGAALTMSAVPALFEIGAVTLAGPWLLGLSWLDSALLGTILGAVSPAVVVPLMIDFMDRGKGEAKGIPTLILAASSIDDVFVIVIFSILLGFLGPAGPGMAATGAAGADWLALLDGVSIAVPAGPAVNWAWQLAGIPLSMILGIIAGLIPGYVLYLFFRRVDLKPPRRTIIVMGVAILLTWVEEVLHGLVPVASLLGVMAMGFIILEKEEAIAHIISSKLKRLWVVAELLLFVLVGAQVNVGVAWRAGLGGLAVIGLGLVARSVGVYLSIWRTDLNRAERLFTVVAYVPKATVQAAIGALPLAAGAPGGEVILAVAVLSIVVTAPLGAIGIKFLGERVLEESDRPAHRFQDLRERLGLPRVGERVRHRTQGTLWKVIEEREQWRRDEADADRPPSPVINLRLWRLIEGQPQGTGQTRRVAFSFLDEPFERDWEIVYG
jgi:NhaP-type Na+/H+ or K+/H+ antiporter